MKDLAVSIATSGLLALATLASLLGRVVTGLLLVLTWLAMWASLRAVQLSRKHTQAWLDKREAERLERLNQNW